MRRWCSRTPIRLHCSNCSWRLASEVTPATRSSCLPQSTWDVLPARLLAAGCVMPRAAYVCSIQTTTCLPCVRQCMGLQLLASLLVHPPTHPPTRFGRRGVRSMICDPDGVMSYEDANVVEAIINKIGNGEKPFIRAPCGDLGPRGYQVCAAGRSSSATPPPLPLHSAVSALLSSMPHSLPAGSVCTTTCDSDAADAAMCVIMAMATPCFLPTLASCTPSPNPLPTFLALPQVAVALMSKFEAGADAAATAKAFARALHDSWGVGDAACQVRVLCWGAGLGVHRSRPCSAGCYGSVLIPHEGRQQPPKRRQPLAFMHTQTHTAEAGHAPSVRRATLAYQLSLFGQAAPLDMLCCLGMLPRCRMACCCCCPSATASPTSAQARGRSRCCRTRRHYRSWTT
jgi:hypothetical protein